MKRTWLVLTTLVVAVVLIVGLAVAQLKVRDETLKPGRTSRIVTSGIVVRT